MPPPESDRKPDSADLVAKGEGTLAALDYRRLLSVLVELSAAKDLDSVVAVVRDRARSLVGCDGLTFVLREGDQVFYRDESAIAPLWKGRRFPASACISGWAIEHRQSVVIEDIYSDPRIPCEAYEPTFVKSLMMVPIRASDPIGAIGAYWATRHEATPVQLDLLQAVADAAALAVRNAELRAERKAAEDALRQSEEELSDFFENSAVGLHWVGPDGTILRVNQAELDLLGYSREEYVGQNIAKFHADEATIKDILRRLTCGETLNSYEARLRCKDGSIRHVLITSNVRWREGTFLHTRCFTRDITERRRAEEAARVRAAQVEALLDAAPLGVYLVDANFRIRHMNPTALAASGNLPDVIGRNFEEVLRRAWPKAYADEILERFRHTLATGESYVVSERGEKRVDRGVVEYYEWRINRIPLPDGYGIVCYFRDIAAHVRAREHLEEAQRHLRTISNNATVGLLMMDDRQHMTFINPAGEKIIGFTFEECQGKPLHYVIHHTRPDGSHYPMEECPIDRALHERNQTQGEDVFVRRDGSFYPVAFTASPIIENGKPVGTVIELRDITEEKRSHEALRVRTAQVEALLNNAPLGVFLVGHDFRLRQANPTALAVFGQIPDLIGRDFEEILRILWPKGMADRVVMRYRHTLETGEPYIDPEVAEERLDRRVTEYYEWQIHRIPLPDGHGIVCYFRDISAHVRARESLKEAERTIRESEERFRALAENIPQLAWMAEETGWIFWYNKRWFDYTGTTLDEMQGWGWRRVHHPDHIDRVTEKWKTALAEGRGWEDTFPLRGKDGLFRWFLSRAFPIYDQTGNVLRWFGTNTDVTEQRETQEALRQAVQARDVFLSIASHELKTPLTPLTLQLQGIERMVEKEDGGVQPQRIMEKVGKAGKQVAHLERLVRDLLDVSRLSEDKLTLNIEPLDLTRLVSEAVERLKPEIQRAECQVSLRANGSVEGAWDPLRLDQVVTNLLSNALKYGRGKPVEVEVRSDGAVATILVRDHGIGISPEDQKRIFGRFERAVSDRNYGGFGLGLWIARQVIEAMGGTITVESRVNAGSTFRVELPRQSPAGT
jgi:PAS domain S-box-containing protein